MCPASQIENWSLKDRIVIVRENGIEKKVPALDKYWVDNRPIAKYYPFPINNGSSANKYEAIIEEWTKDSTCFNEDLEWLLQLEFHKFWSQVIFDPNIMQAIGSFLQEATPCYTPILSFCTNDAALNVYRAILKNVVNIICRLMNAKESEKDWMSKEFLADLIYSKYLISIPMVLDLLVALGGENQMVLNKMLTLLFKIQPKYLNDLKNGLEFIKASFISIQEQVQSMNQQNLDDEPVDSHEMEVLCLSVLDCVVTLNLLLDVYPESKEMATEANVPGSISQFYENTIPLMYKLVHESDKNQNSLKYLSNTRIELLNTFHGIVNYFLEILLNKDRAETGEISDKIITILEESMSDITFAIDYQKMYAIENDLDVIRQVCDSIHAMRLDYVNVAYRDAYLESDKVKVEDDEEMSCLNESPEENGVDHLVPEPMAGPSISNGLTDEELKVRQILDVFPDYGDGFIRKILKRYDMNAELVITAILEGNLPPDLANADTAEPYIPEEEAAFFVETGIKRLNIYDGDEFDVMTNDNIKGIHKKGVGENKKWETLLNDKSHIHAMKSRYTELGLVEEDHEYSDEYDDSYDALADSEAKTVKLKAAAAVVFDDTEDSESNGEEETSAGPSRDVTKDFCENPEAVRERYEQRRQQKFGARTFKSREVVGKPKGQGQDDETLKNRQKKNVNKSNVGNHNRKQGAAFKRGKGMF